ncbi:MAG TPA: PKD domain-containing protein, partial [Longimicrobiales bacterium]|nr:PKD domain-containing protein [Longimicrobiales bacterium]
MPAALAALLAVTMAAALLVPARAAAQTVVIDSVLPHANTVYSDLDSATPGVQFVWCIADTVTLLNAGDPYTQDGVLKWFGYVPDNTNYPTYTEVQVDSATAATRPSGCAAYQVGNTSTLQKGLYSFYAIVQLTEQAGTPLTALDTAVIDSVWLYPSPAHIAFANFMTGAPDPRDTIYTANPSPDVVIATDLGPGQNTHVKVLYTPFGSSVPVDSATSWYAVTDSTGVAPVYEETPLLFSGDGSYAVIAASDSVPGTFAPARDTMIYIYTSAGLGMQVIQPDSGGTYATAFEVHGKVAPGTPLLLNCNCTETGDTTTSAADSTWTFGTVHFNTDTVTIRWADPTFPGLYSNGITIPFTFGAANQPPTATITAPSQDTTVFVGDTVAFAGTGTDPDGTIASYAWVFGDAATAATATASHAYAAAGTDTVLFTVTDDSGATSVPDTVVVTAVNNQPPTATITAPSQDTTVFVGDTVAFSGTGTDADGTVTGYAWAFGDGATASTATASHAYAAAGTDTVLFT